MEHAATLRTEATYRSRFLDALLSVLPGRRIFVPVGEEARDVFYEACECAVPQALREPQYQPQNTRKPRKPLYV